MLTSDYYFSRRRANYRGVGTGPADPAAAGPKFALSIKIETHNSKKFQLFGKSTQLCMMQLAISILCNLLFLLTKQSYNGPLTFLHAIIIFIIRHL